MNLKQAKRIRKAMRKYGRVDWRAAEYTTNRKGTVMLADGCAKQRYRQIKRNYLNDSL